MSAASEDASIGNALAHDAPAQRHAIRTHHRIAEPPLALGLAQRVAAWYRHDAVAVGARRLVAAQRARVLDGFGIEQFLQEYQLGTDEGIRLLCLAEAFLRIPDATTAAATGRRMPGNRRRPWSMHRRWPCAWRSG